MKIIQIMKIIMLLSSFFLPAALQAAIPAGEVSSVSKGVVEARAADGSVRTLRKNDAVYSGESITTGKGATVHISFADGSRFAVGSQAEFRLDKFVYKQGSDDDAFHSRIIKGAFRFISGLIAKSPRRDMTVGTVVATIGIRGTEVQGEVSARSEKDGVTVDASARIMLLEPEDKNEQTSIIVSNDFGSVVIDKPGYGTEIPDEKSPPSAVRKMQLRTIDNMLRALRNATRQGGTARPRMP